MALEPRNVKQRILAFLLANTGKVVTRQEIVKAARDPITGADPENWHQRLSELRTDDGYTILSNRDRRDLRPGQYLMPNAERRETAARRVIIRPGTWTRVLERAGYTCEWVDGGVSCGLRDGDLDPIGGGTVRLTPDHKTPHSINPASDAENAEHWQALCGRHQVVKKNYWDHTTGKLNTLAIVQAAPEAVKRVVYDFLRKYFGHA